MIASNSAPRWRTRTSSRRAQAALAVAGRRSPRAIQLRTVSAICCASCTCGLVSVIVSNGASQPSTRLRFVGSIQSARSRPGPAPPARSASCTVAVRLGGEARIGFGAREHGIDRAQHVRRRAERMLELRPASNASPRVSMRAARNAAASRRSGAAPRPGTKRSTASRRRPRRSCADAAARAGAGEELRGEPARSRPTASGWCPAPRRSADGRCRGRACRCTQAAAHVVEQRERLVDQVVVVEQAAPVLLGAIARRSPHRRW